MCGTAVSAQLNHIRLGRGEPLLLLHPLGADLHVWEPVLERLAAEREVIAVDMPGFGNSAVLPAAAAPTPPALAKAVAAFMDQLALDGAHAAGISLGGWVALELAKLGRARTATGLCPAGFWSRPLGPRRETSRNISRLARPLLPVLLRSERVRRFALSGSVARPERVPFEAALQLVRAYATGAGFDEASSAMRSAVFEGMEQVSVPVTLAWAEHDRLVKKPRKIPDGVRSLDLPGCGHVPTWDDPELVARVLLDGSEPDPYSIDATVQAR
jgi:pimeloyl-ACP methyl ester carboxylesterase